MELHVLLKDTSKVKRTGENVCVCLESGRCNTVYHLCVLWEGCVDWWVFAVCVFFWCPQHAILSLIQNTITQCSPHESFTVRHRHYFVCGHVLFPVDLSPRFTRCRCSNNREAFRKCFPINLTKNTLNPSTCDARSPRSHMHIKCKCHPLHSTTLPCLTHTQLYHTPTPVSLLLFSDSQIIFTVDLRQALYNSLFFFFLSCLLPLKSSRTCS